MNDKIIKKLSSWGLLPQLLNGFVGKNSGYRMKAIMAG